MAGGEGTRLRPLTCNIPKPMMPILDKPVMQYAVELLEKNRITDIGVTLQYLPDEIINYFGDGRELGVNMRYFIEETSLGTAGSVKNAESFLDETFVVISGDALTDIDISRAIKYHKKKKAMATLILKEVDVPLEYGVVLTDSDGRVKEFLEKPSWSEVFSDKVNTGIYILEPEIFNYCHKKNKFDFSHDLFPFLLDLGKPIYGYVTDGYWCDIGNIEQYLKCHKDILTQKLNVKIKGTKFKNGVWIGENCHINPNCKIISPSYIGSNTKIYEDVEIGPYTAIGMNNIISSGATIKRSILFDNCYIGTKSEVRGAVICEKVQLESKVSIFEEAAIGQETLIRQRVVVKPRVKIWPNKVVEASAVVKGNIIWGGKFSKSLFGKNGIRGEINVDITPEFVSKLGSAYASLLKMGSRIAISCSDDGAAKIFKYSLLTGLLSMGIQVYDLKILTISILRKAVVFFGVKGGVHISVDKEHAQKLKITFINENGLDLDKNIERKIENSFIREDFRRVKSDSFKSIIHMYDCVESYKRSQLNKMNIDNIKNKRYKAILSIRNELLLSVVKDIFIDLKIEVLSYNKYENYVELSNEVIHKKADIGIFITDEGEEAVLVDEKGKMIKKELYEALKAFVLLKGTKLTCLAVPVTASQTLESVARMCGAKFIRTKSSQNNILKVLIENQDTISKKEIIDSYLMTLDAVSTITLIISFMAYSNSSLSMIIKQIPIYHAKNTQINCPWNMKGKVMRKLIEENTSESMELIEGVKLNYKNVWALVIPDGDEPLCRIYAESSNSESVEKISDKIIEKIEQITSGIGKKQV